MSRSGALYAPAADHLDGTGPPEGVIAAPVGTRYTDRNATTGAVEWTKTSGTGTTGWIVAVADTGRRNIASLVDTGTDGIVHFARLQRIGNWVDVVLDVTSPTAVGSPWVVLTLPDGFESPVTRYGGLVYYAGAISKHTYIAGAEIRLYVTTGGQRDRFWGSWPTDYPWPIALPGTAV